MEGPVPQYQAENAIAARSRIYATPSPTRVLERY